MFDKAKVQIEKIEETVRPVTNYIHHRRGRFSALGMFIVMYPLLERPRHPWTEFEKDFRMYDSLAKKK